MRNCELLCFLAVAGLCLSAQAASAQTFEDVGVRAQGLAGAFVAVADDATATWWNPAGLATGPYLSSVLEYGQTTMPDGRPPGGSAQRTTLGDFAVAYPALGLSYYRLRVSQIADPGSTGGDAGNREDPGISGTSLRSVAVNQFAASFGQSLGDHLVVGATVKLLHAGAAVGEGPADAGFDLVEDLDVDRHYALDVDLGAMAGVGHLRVGFTVRNLTEPDFGANDGAPLTIERQARLGVAVKSEPTAVMRGFTVAADADLTTTSTVVGETRHVAAGFESWFGEGRFGVRAGGSANTVGDARPAGSVGASVGLTRAMQVSVSRTFGRDETVTGWSTSVSLAF